MVTVGSRATTNAVGDCIITHFSVIYRRVETSVCVSSMDIAAKHCKWWRRIIIKWNRIHHHWLLFKQASLLLSSTNTCARLFDLDWPSTSPLFLFFFTFKQAGVFARASPSGKQHWSTVRFIVVDVEPIVIDVCCIYNNRQMIFICLYGILLVL